MKSRRWKKLKFQIVLRVQCRTNFWTPFLTYKMTYHHMVCEHEKLLNAQWENLLVLNDWMGLSSPEYYPILSLLQLWMSCTLSFAHGLVTWHFYLVAICFYFVTHLKSCTYIHTCTCKVWILAPKEMRDETQLNLYVKYLTWHRFSSSSEYMYV